MRIIVVTHKRGGVHFSRSRFSKNMMPFARFKRDENRQEGACRWALENIESVQHSLGEGEGRGTSFPRLPQNIRKSSAGQPPNYQLLHVLCYVRHRFYTQVATTTLTHPSRQYHYD